MIDFAHKEAWNLDHPRDLLVRTMRRIYQYRMTTTSGGNLSIQDEEEGIWITPSRVDKGSLTRQDMVRVLPNGEAVGAHPPSSEFPFHRLIYETRADAGAIIHAHSVALVAFSMVKEVPDTRVFPKARRICGEVAFAPYALPGSEKLGQNIAEKFAGGANCVVLENHGVVVCGKDMEEAFERFETLEFTARSILRARQLGPLSVLSDDQLREAAQRRQEEVKPPTEEPGLSEKEKRAELVRFVRRGGEQQLLISTAGSFSSRLDAENFLITGSSADRMFLEARDIVRVGPDGNEGWRQPSKASFLHRAIYQAHPNVNAIVNALPPCAMAFCLANAKLETKTIPESYIVLRDVGNVSYEQLYREPESLAQQISLEQPVLLVVNDGILAVGKDMLDLFDRLEVLETTAQAILDASSLGQIRPIGGEAIEELKAAFF